MKTIRYILTLMAVIIMTAVNVNAQSLLDGKKWTTAKNVSGSSGTMQGAAYYDGKIYQFTDKCAKYGVYDIASNTWSAGEALNTGVLANCHFGSACFGPESTKTYTVGGVQHTSSFPLLFVTAHDTKNANGNILIHVIDFEQKSVVTTLKFPHSDARDDKIAGYDFANGKIYIFGYPVKVLEGHSPYTVWTYSDVNFNTFASSEITMSPNLTNETNAQTGIGGPNAEGIQENLACGTLQDCHYHDGYIYYATSRGSEYNRTEFAKVHALNMSNWEVEKTLVCNNATEPEGFAFDGTNFYMTCGGAKLWKLSAGSGYDANNYQPATLISGGAYDGYYEITNASQFVWFKSMVYNGCTTMKAYLANDIDMTGQTDPFTYYIYDKTVQSGTTTPKFEAQFAFRGIFDGNGHKISNVNITSTPYYNDGVFPYVMGATIKNVTVEGNIKLTTCKTSAGTGQSVSNVGLIGYMDGGTVENVDVKGLTIDETVAGVSGTINKLIGSENGTITKTNCVTENPSSTTHSQNSGNHVYINGFCSLSDASVSEAGYYETPAGEGTEGSPYLINNAGKLWWFANYVNGLGTGNQAIHAKLTADVDMEGSTRGSFPGIGKYQGAVYAGTFDGQGHTISNFYRASSTFYNGLFTNVTGTVKKFNINGEVYCNGAQQHGSVVGLVQSGALIEDVHSSVSVYAVTGMNQTGGFAGRIQGTVNRCRYSGTIQGTDGNAPYNKFGGFVGSLVGGTISNCLFDGKMITASTSTSLYAGGFAGGSFDTAGGKMLNCLMVGTITSTGTTTGVGIIVGNIANNTYNASKIYYSLDKVQSGVTQFYGVKGSGATVTIEEFNNCSGMTWSAVKDALNDGSTNWGINSQLYPVPGEEDGTPATTYTITFNTNGGDPCASQSGAENSTITLPTPTKSGYTFTGWTVAADGSGDKLTGGSSYTITGDATLYAQWTVYTTSFDSNGFNTQFSTCAEEDKYESATKDTDGYYIIDNAGKLFWFANQVNAGNASYNAKVTKDIDMDGTNHPDFPGIGIYQNVKENPIRKPFSGNFDGQGHRIYNCDITNNGSDYWGGGLIVTANGTNNYIKDFTLEGKVTINTNAYAGGAVGYIEKGYTISGITSSVTITSKAGKTGGVAGFVNTGSISKCRYNGTLTSSAVNVGGIIGETAVSMTDCLFDGKIVSTQTGNTGSCVGGLAAAARGVTIQNCMVYGTITTSVTGVSTSMVVGRVENNGLTLTNIYYKAKETSTPTIAYNANSKTVTATNVTAITTETWQQIKTALNNSRVPTIWGINSQVYPVPGEADQTQYTVTFNSKGGSECASVSKVANTVIALPTPTKSGFLFTGWTVAEDGSGTKYAGGANYTITEDVTLYAQWELAYTITFVTNGGSACDAVTKTAGTVINLPTPTKVDHMFDGWTTAEDGTGTKYAGGASYTITADVTLYAQWTEDETGDYRNGFHKTHAKTADDYYQAPELITAERCTALGIDASYATNVYYEVKNAGNMFWIAKNLSEDNNTRKYVMTDNINMAGDDANHKDWAGIGDYNGGNSAKHFMGTFDGLGHKFTNFYMKPTADRKSLFNLINGATLLNFSIAGDVEITGNNAQIGAVVARVQSGASTLTDIHSSVTFTVTEGKTPQAIGGIVGQCSAQTTFNRCRYSGTIDGKSAYRNLGGIFGNSEAVVTVNNCLFDGSISSTSTVTGSGDNAIQIGGIAGRNNNTTTITNSLVNGTISVAAGSEALDAEKTHTGIIFGYQYTNKDLTITNTYYSTTGSTIGLRAVGLNSATNQSKAAPTEKTTQTWDAIKTSLNGSSDPVNWGINSQVYPVPGEKDGVTKYTITFDTNGGTPIDPIVQAAGTAVTAPANPTKTGYTFNGWSPTVPATMPAENITITATWTVNQYTIKFDLNGGTSAAIADITQDYGTAITKPTDPTKEDWDFNGWSPAVPSTMPAGNMTCVAQWVREEYENGFNTNASCAADVKYQKPKGSGTTEDPYIINNGGKLWWFANQVKTDKTLCAKLTDDVNTECNTRVTNVSTNMPQMGAWGSPYTGTFDGNGYTISNWKQIWSGFRAGMFGYTTNATIKNFTLEGEMTVSGSLQQMAPVVGNAGAGTTIEDIWSKVNIAANGTVFIVGGVAGRQAGTLNRCRYSGTITCADGVYNGIGGIVGETYAGTTNNCLFDGTIIAPSSDATLRVGGIVGTQSEAAASTIKNCFANGTITLANYSTETSGVVMGGNTNQQYVYNMYYTRTKVSASLKRAAGISTKSAMGHCEDVTGKAIITDGTLRDLLGNGNWKQDATLGYPVPHKGTATAGLDANGFSYSKDGTHDAVTLNGEWYEIANGGQLLDFAQKVNAGTIALTSKARLATDVDLEWCDFPGIGDYSSSKKFQGTFDGQGHTISGMFRLVQGSVQRKGMFNWVENATIKDFTVEGEIQIHEGTNSTFFIGGVVGIGDTAGTLEDVTSSVDINVIKCGETTRIIGGVAGRFKGTMNRCRYNGTIDLATNTAQQIGGVLASAEVTTMSNCLFDGTILAATANTAADKVVIGGLLGIDNNAVTMKNCLSNGTITLSNAAVVTTNVGAVWGQIAKAASSSTVTYYTTSDITKAGAALDQVGGTNASSNMSTIKVEDTWENVTLKLNNDVSSAGNWQIIEGQDYPIPSEFSHEHSYNKFGYCTVCNAPEPIGDPVVDPDDGKSYYQIDHLADLGQFRDMVNTSAKGTEFNAKATADIDLTGLGRGLGGLIGNDAHPYVGTFDGQGHKVVGIDETSSERYMGVFNVVGMKGTTEATSKAGIVKNFSVYGKMTSNYFSTWNSNTPLCMGVVGQLRTGTVENIHSYLTYCCTTGTKAHIGGVVGGSLHSGTDLGEAVVKNCSYSGTINVNANDNIGGIIGYAQHKTYISHCLYDGSIIQNWTRNANEVDGDATNGPCATYIGGILGYTNSTSNGVKNCIIVGTMESNLTIVSDGTMKKSNNNMNICVGYDGSISTSYEHYYGNFISQTVIDTYHQYPTDKFSGTARIRSDAEFATGAVCAELNADDELDDDDNPWGQILGYQIGSNKDPNSPAQKCPFPGYTDPNKTSYKVVRTVNADWNAKSDEEKAADPKKYDYTADYYFFDDFGDTTPYPSDAASMKVKRIKYTRGASYMKTETVESSKMTGYISVCFPFNIADSRLSFNNEWKVKKFNRVSKDDSDGKYKVEFSTINHNDIEAGVPYFIQLDDDSNGEAWEIDVTDNANPFVLELAPQNPSTGILGAFNTTSCPVWSESTPVYKLKHDGKTLVRTISGSMCYPYRGYLTFAKPTGASAPVYVLCFDDDDEATGVETVDSRNLPSGQRYNILGQKVDQYTKGLVIINGRKFMVK